jgi:DNA-directed RNA polymerase subunit RPC12/RpoP
MKGSGIYSEDYTGIFNCATCEKDFEIDGQTDDWKHTAYADCPECGAELEVDLTTDERDDDFDYDAWRESQLDD